MTGLPCQLEHQAIGEVESGPRAEQIEGRRDSIGVLQRQVAVVEQLTGVMGSPNREVRGAL